MKRLAEKLMKSLTASLVFMKLFNGFYFEKVGISADPKGNACGDNYSVVLLDKAVFL